MGEHTHDSECELYSEACGCDSRHALKQQRDMLLEALEKIEQVKAGTVTTSYDMRRIAIAAIAAVESEK